MFQHKQTNKNKNKKIDFGASNTVQQITESSAFNNYFVGSCNYIFTFILLASNNFSIF